MMFTLFKFCLVFVAVAGGLALLKKNGLTGSGGIIPETMKKLWTEPDEVECTTKNDDTEPHAYGRYTLNVLDSERIRLPLPDLRLEKGQGIVISEHGEASSNPHVVETIALGKYSELAKELRGALPILVFRDNKSGDIYVRFDAANHCYEVKEADSLVEFQAGKALKMEEICQYNKERIFLVSGVKLAFTYNSTYMEKNGKLKATAKLHTGTTYIDDPESKSNGFCL